MAHTGHTTTVWGSCSVAVWGSGSVGQLRFGAVAIWGSHIVAEMHYVGVMVVTKPEFIAF